MWRDRNRVAPEEPFDICYPSDHGYTAYIKPSEKLPPTSIEKFSLQKSSIEKSPKSPENKFSVSEGNNDGKSPQHQKGRQDKSLPNESLREKKQSPFLTSLIDAPSLKTWATDEMRDESKKKQTCKAQEKATPARKNILVFNSPNKKIELHSPDSSKDRAALTDRSQAANDRASAARTQADRLLNDRSHAERLLAESRLLADRALVRPDTPTNNQYLAKNPFSTPTASPNRSPTKSPQKVSSASCSPTQPKKFDYKTKTWEQVLEDPKTSRNFLIAEEWISACDRLTSPVVKHDIRESSVKQDAMSPGVKDSSASLPRKEIVAIASAAGWSVRTDLLAAKRGAPPSTSNSPDRQKNTLSSARTDSVSGSPVVGGSNTKASFQSIRQEIKAVAKNATFTAREETDRPRNNTGRVSAEKRREQNPVLGTKEEGSKETAAKSPPKDNCAKSRPKESGAKSPPKDNSTNKTPISSNEPPDTSKVSPSKTEGSLPERTRVDAQTRRSIPSGLKSTVPPQQRRSVSYDLPTSRSAESRNAERRKDFVKLEDTSRSPNNNVTKVDMTKVVDWIVDNLSGRSPKTRSMGLRGNVITRSPSSSLRQEIAGDQNDRVACLQLRDGKRPESATSTTPGEKKEGNVFDSAERTLNRQKGSVVSKIYGSEQVDEKQKVDKAKASTIVPKAPATTTGTQPTADSTTNNPAAGWSLVSSRLYGSPDAANTFKIFTKKGSGLQRSQSRSESQSPSSKYSILSSNRNGDGATQGSVLKSSSMNSIKKFPSSLPGKQSDGGVTARQSTAAKVPDRPATANAATPPAATPSTASPLRHYSSALSRNASFGASASQIWGNLNRAPSISASPTRNHDYNPFAKAVEQEGEEPKTNPYARGNPDKYATREYWEERFECMLTSHKGSMKNKDSSLSPTRSKPTIAPTGSKDTVKTAAENTEGTGSASARASSVAAASDASSPGKPKQYVPAFEEFYNFKYSHVCPLINQYVKKTDKILHIGCGLSQFGVDMYKDGFKGIVNTDVSAVCVTSMAKAYPKHRFARVDIFDLVKNKKAGGDDSDSDGGPNDDSLIRFGGGSRGSRVGSTSPTNHRSPGDDDNSDDSDDEGNSPTSNSPNSTKKRPTSKSSKRSKGSTFSMEDPELVPYQYCSVGGVDVVLDKGVLDAILCGRGAETRFRRSMGQFYHSLKDNSGLYICLAGLSLTKSYLEGVIAESQMISPVAKSSPDPSTSPKYKISERLLRLSRVSNRDVGHPCDKVADGQDPGGSKTNVDGSTTDGKTSGNNSGSSSSTSLGEPGKGGESPKSPRGKNPSTKATDHKAIDPPRRKFAVGRWKLIAKITKPDNRTNSRTAMYVMRKIGQSDLSKLRECNDQYASLKEA